MPLHKEQFIIDKDGNRLAVILDITTYEQILADLEELAAIRAYDAAKASGDEAIPFEQALAEIEEKRPDV